MLRQCLNATYGSHVCEIIVPLSYLSRGIISKSSLALLPYLGEHNRRGFSHFTVGKVSAWQQMVVTYPTSIAFWPEQGSLNVRDVEEKSIANIPIGFLDDCQERNWHFVLQIIEDCIIEAGTLSYTDSGSMVDLQRDTVLAGRYTFQRIGGFRMKPNLPYNLSMLRR